MTLDVALGWKRLICLKSSLNQFNANTSSNWKDFFFSFHKTLICMAYDVPKVRSNLHQQTPITKLIVVISLKTFLSGISSLKIIGHPRKFCFIVYCGFVNVAWIKGTWGEVDLTAQSTSFHNYSLWNTCGKLKKSLSKASTCSCPLPFPGGQEMAIQRSTGTGWNDNTMHVPKLFDTDVQMKTSADVI